MASRKWRKTEAVVFSGLFFFDYFLLEEQKKVINGFPAANPRALLVQLVASVP
jgi:hypothetical protein